MSTHLQILLGTSWRFARMFLPHTFSYILFTKELYITRKTSLKLNRSSHQEASFQSLKWVPIVDGLQCSSIHSPEMPGNEHYLKRWLDSRVALVEKGSFSGCSFIWESLFLLTNVFSDIHNHHSIASFNMQSSECSQAMLQCLHPILASGFNCIVTVQLFLF